MSRQYKLIAEFACDAEGCYRRFRRTETSPDVSNILAPRVTTMARDEGWYIPKSGSVYCPDHPEYFGHNDANYSKGCRCAICTQAHATKARLQRRSLTKKALTVEVERLRKALAARSVCNQGHSDPDQCDVGVCDSATPAADDSMSVSFSGQER